MLLSLSMWLVQMIIIKLNNKIGRYVASSKSCFLNIQQRIWLPYILLYLSLEVLVSLILIMDSLLQLSILQLETIHGPILSCKKSSMHQGNHHLFLRQCLFVCSFLIKPSAAIGDVDRFWYLGSSTLAGSRTGESILQILMQLLQQLTQNGSCQEMDQLCST